MHQTTFSDDEVQRLSPPAVHTLPRLAAVWRLSDEVAAALAGVSQDDWKRMKAGHWEGELTQDQLLRASFLIGIFADLRRLYDKPKADAWPNLASHAPIFDGNTPVQAMLERGIPKMLEIREHLAGLMADPW